MTHPDPRCPDISNFLRFHRPTFTTGTRTRRTRARVCRHIDFPGVFRAYVFFCNFAFVPKSGQCIDLWWKCKLGSRRPHCFFTSLRRSRVAVLSKLNLMSTVQIFNYLAKRLTNLESNVSQMFIHRRRLIVEIFNFERFKAKLIFSVFMIFAERNDAISSKKKFRRGCISRDRVCSSCDNCFTFANQLVVLRPVPLSLEKYS